MKSRQYGATKELSTQVLRTHFQSLSYVKTAFLFGSRASGHAHSKSDYDFALEMEELPDEHWGMQAKAWMDVCDLLGLKEFDVDVVDLRLADGYLKSSIAQNHILIKGAEDDISRLLT